MDMMVTILTALGTVLTAVGGWEAVRYVMNRKTNARISEANADNVEFGVLRDTMNFLQAQLKEKEERFAEQTELVRKQNAEILSLSTDLATLRHQLATYKCEVRHCPNRQPPNEY